jgi:pimeloyl-ACP methyl ester carboxylesterase
MANVNGIDLNYTAQGEGEPLVMINGANEVQRNWRRQIGPFKKHYRVVTFDNRGVGKSGKPPGPYTTRMMADDTVGLMDHLGIPKAHVLGVSMGGMIAQELAINHPERVDKLVLGSTHARRDETSGFSPAINEALEAYERSPRDEASQRRFGSATMPLAINNWSNRVFLLPLMKLVIRFAPVRSFGRAMEQFEAAATHDAADRLGMIKAPTLVVCGTEDRSIRPTSSDVIASLVPKAKLVKIAGGSHALCMEKSGEFNREVLDFLAN